MGRRGTRCVSASKAGFDLGGPWGFGAKISRFGKGAGRDGDVAEV